MTYQYEPWKRTPTVAAERKRLAAHMRKVHREHPQMARLIWRRIKLARKANDELVNKLFSEGSAPGLKELWR